MNFHDFKNEIPKMIQQKLNNAYTVSLEEVIKTNDQIYTGLLIRNENEDVIPTIYLEEFYHQYLAGKTLNEITDNILSVYINALQHIPTPKTPSRDDFIKNLTPTVVNADLNKALLKDLPHIRFEDLAVYLRYCFNESDDRQMSVKVTSNLLASYNLTKDEAMEYAIDNLEHSKFQFKPLYQILNSILNEDDFDSFPTIFVVTNQNNIYGASCMASKKILSRIADNVLGDYYILPSSVHEILIVPKDFIDRPEELRNMVQEINETMVSETELLSNNIYEFDSVTKKLKMFIDNPIEKIAKAKTHSIKM